MLYRSLKCIQTTNLQMSEKGKRGDLQSFRAIAIVTVLLFHFFSDYFPNGYLGVDMFFVISGYLMMMIFGSKKISFKSTKEFYSKRIRRILPLYLFVILIVLLFTFFAFPSQFVSVNKESSIFAITFTSNIPRRSIENNYFLQLKSALDLFTHTWSLSVEMQFYLIAPLLFHITSLANSQRLQFCAHCVIFVASLTLQFSCHEVMAFNSVLCRLWQVGMLCFIMERRRFLKKDNEIYLSICDDQKNKSPSTADFGCIRILFFCTMFVLILSSLWPLTVCEHFARVVVTLCTGIAILSSGQLQLGLMSHRRFVYLGNISYSLYLIHWPIYCFVKFYSPTSVTVDAISKMCRPEPSSKSKPSHTGEKRFGCEECGRSFSQKQTLTRHKMTHSSEEPYKCGECGSVFKRKDHLRMHIMRHTGEGPYRCEVCERRFPAKSEFKRHMEIHTGEKTFTCKECGVAFSSRSALSIHFQKTHGEIDEQKEQIDCSGTSNTDF